MRLHVIKLYIAVDENFMLKIREIHKLQSHLNNSTYTYQT